MSNVKIFSDPEAVARAAGKEFLKVVSVALKKKDFFTVALSGGSTPEHLYKYLLKELIALPEHEAILKKIHFFWGDEREVPPEDPQSNFGNAHRIFFSKIDILEDNIHRIKPGEGGAQKAAVLYEQMLHSFFDLEEGQWPRFDLIFLGMGEDGHTASLFPKTLALEEKRRFVIAPFVEKLDAHRITLTVPVFNHARSVIFLVSGKSKAETLQKVLNGPYQPGIYPAQLIAPQKGKLVWLVDRAAAELLDQNTRRNSKNSDAHKGVKQGDDI